jgi:uncharacterized lipoprotein YajG
MKKLIIIVLIFILMSCATTEKTISVSSDSSKVISDSTQVVNQISEEDQLGYILVVAIVGFIVISLIGLSHIMPPPGIQ